MEALVEPSEHQKSMLAKLCVEAGDQEEADITKKRKRKRAKGPNPLSVKKSTKMRGGGTRPSSKGGITQSKVWVLNMANSSTSSVSWQCNFSI